MDSIIGKVLYVVYAYFYKIQILARVFYDEKHNNHNNIYNNIFS